jgi:Trk K+ transport system NAD-binding subunit/multidrug transporter EmrE-like cation transporter
MTAMLSGRPVLLDGGGRLAAAIAQRLEAAGATVARVVMSEQGLDGTEQLETAAVLVLAADDDAGNVDRALWARRVRPDLPLVARVFDESLARYLTGNVERLTILSMSQLAAPVFAEAALRVLGQAPARSAPRRPPPPRSRSRPDRVLVGALVGLALVVVPSTFFFARVLKLRIVDALYFVWTTVMTVGYGDISLRETSDGAKIVGMLLMLAGAAFVATLFAFLTGWVVTRRLDVLRGRVQVRGQGHAVIAGAGNLGVRVANLLVGQERRVVIIERNQDSRNLSALRADGHHVIVADATDEQILDLAGVDRAGAVLVLTDSDAVNLQIVLLLRARSVTAPVVIKMISPELSAHVSQRGDGIALSPIAVAAQAFADAALAQEPPS